METSYVNPSSDIRTPLAPTMAAREEITTVTTFTGDHHEIKTRISVTTEDSFDARSKGNSVLLHDDRDDCDTTGRAGDGLPMNSSLDQWRSIVANNEHILMPQPRKGNKLRGDTPGKPTAEQQQQQQQQQRQQQMQQHQQQQYYDDGIRDDFNVGSRGFLTPSNSLEQWRALVASNSHILSPKPRKDRIRAASNPNKTTDMQSSQHNSDDAVRDDSTSVTSSSLEQWRTLVANNEHILLSKPNRVTTQGNIGKRISVIKPKTVLQNNVFCGMEVSSSKRTLTSSTCTESATFDESVSVLDDEQIWKSPHCNNMQQQRIASIVTATPSILDQDDGESDNDNDSHCQDGGSDAGDSNVNLVGPMEAPSFTASVEADTATSMSIMSAQDVPTPATRTARGLFCNACRCGGDAGVADEDVDMQVKSSPNSSVLQRDGNEAAEPAPSSSFDKTANSCVEPKHNVLPPGADCTSNESENDGQQDNQRSELPPKETNDSTKGDEIISFSPKPSYLQEESKSMIQSIAEQDTMTEENNSNSAEIIMVDFGEQNVHGTHSPDQAEKAVIQKHIMTRGNSILLVDDVNDKLDDDVGDITFKGGGCIGAMTIPMAESDIYSCHDEQLPENFEEDVNLGGTDEDMHDDELEQIYSDSCSSSSASSGGFSNFTGPLPMTSSYPSKASVCESGVVIVDGDGFMAMNFEDGVQTYSLDNDTMVFPSHLHFCNAVTDGILVIADSGSHDEKSEESVDLYDSITDSFERHVADEFVKTFQGLGNHPSGDNSSCSSSDCSYSVDDGFRSCADIDIIEAKASSGEHFLDNENKDTAAIGSVKAQANDRSNSQATAAAANLFSKESQSALEIIHLQEKETRPALDQVYNTQQPKVKPPTSILSTDSVLQKSPPTKYEIPSDSSNCLSEKAQNNSIQIPFKSELSGSHSSLSAKISSKTKSVKVKTPSLVNISESQQCKSVPANLSCDPGLKEATLVLVHENQDRTAQNDAEVILKQTYHEEATPQHSNCTPVFHQLTNQRMPEAQSEKTVSVTSSTFTSFLQKMTCYTESDNESRPYSNAKSAQEVTSESISQNAASPPTSNSNSKEASVDQLYQDFERRTDETTAEFAKLCSASFDGTTVLVEAAAVSTADESHADSFNDLQDLVDSQDPPKHANNDKRSDSQNATSSGKKTKSYRRLRSSQEISSSVGQVLKSLFSEEISDEVSDDSKTIILSKSTVSTSKNSGRSQEEVVSNADRVQLPLFEYSSEEDDEGESTASSNIVVDSTPGVTTSKHSKKIKKMSKRLSQKDVSNSVEKVLHDLFEVPSIEDSLAMNRSSGSARSQTQEEEFLDEFTNNFFDLFNVSTSATIAEDEESTAIDTSDSTQAHHADLSKSMTGSSEADDLSDRDDATLNTIDFEVYGVDKVQRSDIIIIANYETKENLKIKSEDEELNVHDDDFPVDDPAFFFEEGNRGNAFSSSDVCTSIVPFSSIPTRAMAIHFPLYPPVKQPIPIERQFARLSIGAIQLPSPQIMSNILGGSPAFGSIISSHSAQIFRIPQRATVKAKDNAHMIPRENAYNNVYENPNERRTPALTVKTTDDSNTNIEACVLPCATASLAEAMASPLSIEDSNTSIEVCVSPCAMTSLAEAMASPSSPGSKNPEWSFLDLEKSIDASLDNFMNDLLSPVGDAPIEVTDSDSVSVSEEAALQELLNSEYCAEILETMKKQKNLQDTLQMHLDPSASSLEYGFSSTSTSSSSVGNLKAAMALLSDGGESEVPNDFSVDEQSYSPNKEINAFLGDGMPFGVTGLLGEGDISKLDDPNVELPELFAKEHFGSISQMVQEVHLMQAIQIEQKRYTPEFTTTTSSGSEDSIPLQQAQIEVEPNLLTTESLRLGEQHDKLDTLKRELEEEIERMNRGIEKMKLTFDIQENGQSFDEELLGWQEKFEKMKHIKDDPSEDVLFVKEQGSLDCEGIEIELKELSDALMSDESRNDCTRHEYSRRQSSSDQDGLHNEVAELNNFVDELRQELESADESFSKSTEESAEASPEISEEESFSKSGSSSFPLSKSIIDDNTNSSSVEVLIELDSLTQESCKSRRVTFAPTIEEFHYNTADDISTVINFVDKDAASEESATFEELPVVFNNMFAELSYVFGWQTRPESSEATSESALAQA